ncbi:FHF complex subunit HOOK interacting protein 2A-like [Bicyclus anynana]|uniref:FHF complex subunit HOOK interacting protein 2A-like n=1 Tax=Bicyclus anynana TaxID=110368 RepID=A0ABM3LZ64_BICAN|nr:FHF complex subunit HOOK interacting protein 2A-like [Bicyclus anynana]
MLSRFSDVLQSAADVLAPPPSRLEEFQYHWKMVLNFYHNYDESSKQRVEDTRLPHHLQHMLQLLVDEEAEAAAGADAGAGALGACREAVARRAVPLPDALAALAHADRPAGARALALALLAALLRRTRASLHCAPVHGPLRRVLLRAAPPASPTEREEAELLLALCGRVRREPSLAALFTAPLPEEEPALRLPPAAPRRSPLWDVPPPAARVALAGDGRRTPHDEPERLLLAEPLLRHLHSADSRVVLRACEALLVLASLPAPEVAHLLASSPACECVAERLLAAFRAVPADLDPADAEALPAGWASAPPDEPAPRAPGRRQLGAFFGWLDYCDTLCKECHPALAAHLARAFRSHFLDAAGEALSARGALLATALLARCLRRLDAPELVDEFSDWLVGDGPLEEWPLLLTLVDNCLGADHDLTLETLRFFEVIVEKGNERSMERLVLARVSSRGYVAPPAERDDSAERDERERLNDVSFARERERSRDALQQLQHERRVRERVGELLAHERDERAPSPDLHDDINSFLLLLPRAVLSDPLGADYAQYVADAQRQLQHWLDCTAAHAWRRDTRDADADSCDSRAEADRPAPAPFDEGPFLRALLELAARMPERPYRVNLQLTAVLARLALLPHAALREYLLRPALPAAPATRTLFRALSGVAARLAVAVPRLAQHRRRLHRTRLQLLSEDPAADDAPRHPLLETLIVLEEFCKELAAIAFVQHQHERQQR